MAFVLMTEWNEDTIAAAFDRFYIHTHTHTILHACIHSIMCACHAYIHTCIHVLPCIHICIQRYIMNFDKNVKMIPVASELESSERFSGIAMSYSLLRLMRPIDVSWMHISGNNPHIK